MLSDLIPVSPDLPTNKMGQSWHVGDLIEDHKITLTELPTVSTTSFTARYPVLCVSLGIRRGLI